MNVINSSYFVLLHQYDKPYSQIMREIAFPFETLMLLHKIVIYLTHTILGVYAYGLIRWQRVVAAQQLAPDDPYPIISAESMNIPMLSGLISGVLNENAWVSHCQNGRSPSSSSIGVNAAVFCSTGSFFRSGTLKLPDRIEAGMTVRFT